jgi:DNA-binding MarR family transcriptional regulator
VAVPAPPPSATRLFKRSKIRPRPLQRRILEYLSQGGRPSINAISTDLDVWRFSVQRCLRVMKNHGLVEDQWAWFAPNVVPGIKAHMWSITNQGRGELKFLQSTVQESESHPLGYRILLYMSHGGLMTTGQIAKMCSKDKGHVKRVLTSLENSGLVRRCPVSVRTRLGYEAITNLWQITPLGREVLDLSSDAYLRSTRSRMRPFTAILHSKSSNACLTP